MGLKWATWGTVGPETTVGLILGWVCWTVQSILSHCCSLGCSLMIQSNSVVVLCVAPCTSSAAAVAHPGSAAAWLWSVAAVAVQCVALNSRFAAVHLYLVAVDYVVVAVAVSVSAELPCSGRRELGSMEQ